MSKRTISPDPAEQRQVKVKLTMPSVEDILNKIATEYNVKSIPCKDDDLSNNDSIDDEIRKYTDNNMDTAVARWCVAKVLWSHRKISVKNWKQIEPKYEPIIELLKTITQTGSSYKVLRRLCESRCSLPCHQLCLLYPFHQTYTLAILSDLPTRL